MTLPQSKRNHLARGGVTIRAWKETRDRLKELAALRRQTMAETLDALVSEALEAELAQKLQPSEENVSPEGSI